jgi:nitronate monooxygenase
VIASGGIATGSGLAAVLALGAAGANMGTRFMATDEAPIHQNVKDQIVAHNERDTLLVFRKFRNTARVARNRIAEEILEISARPESGFADIAHLASGQRGRENVLAGGDLEGGMWWAGQAQGLIDSVESCHSVISTIISDAEEIISRRLPSLIGSTAASDEVSDDGGDS